MPPPQRYEKVAAWNWPCIGPAFVGIAGTGTGTVRFGAGNGYFGSTTATPV